MNKNENKEPPRRKRFLDRAALNPSQTRTWVFSSAPRTLVIARHHFGLSQPAPAAPTHSLNRAETYSHPWTLNQR